MPQVALLFVLGAVCAICTVLLRRRDLSPTTFWVAGAAVILGSGASTELLAGFGWALPVGYAFGSAYPALLLCGALAFAGRRVPAPLLPAALAFGAARGALAATGNGALGHAAALAVDPPLALAAAWVLYRGTHPTAATPAQRALVPAFVVIAILDGVTAFWSAHGDVLSLELVGFWALFASLLLAVQVHADRDRAQQSLHEVRDALEHRVRERTAELARSVAELEAQVEETRAAEKKMRRSKERYRIVSELSSDYSFALRVDPQGRLHGDWATGALSRITGYEPKEIGGERFFSIIVPEERARARAAFAEAAAGRRDQTEVQIVTKWGERRWLHVRYVRDRGDADGGVRLMGAARDITERKIAEAERRRLEQHMREAQRFESLGLLAGGVAHDFNNLLAVVLGNARLALEELSPRAPLRQRLERIEKAAEHAAALTQQLLTYSGKASVSLAPLDLSRLARELLDLLRASISEKCRLDVDLRNHLPAIDGDETQLRQVILNLVGNASDAVGEQGGELVVRTGAIQASAAELVGTYGTPSPRPGDYVYLEVSDAGPGIDASTQARIFEPFFTTKQAGRGLGLAAVLGIVSAHHGVIDIRSQAGVGTTFRVLFPRSSRVAPAPTRPAGPRKSAAKGVVLVIDDETWVLELAQEFLQRAGFEVLQARGGRAGIELFRAHRERIDAIVLDLAMPDLAGEEVFGELRRIRPDVPVLLTSGYDQARAFQCLTPDPPAGFLSKPYSPEALVGWVRDALEPA